MTQFPQPLFLDLSDAFPGDVQAHSYLLKRALPVIFETEPAAEHMGLAPVKGGEDLPKLAV